MILIIDNYDSFTYNLYQMVGEMEPDIKVVRNDALTVEEIEKTAPAGIIISPGPGRPEDAGVSVDVVKRLGGKVPVLGVCLGHQAICLAYGGRIVHAKHLMHGKQSQVTITGDCPLFEGIPRTFGAARYHSLAADGDSLPDCLEVTATADDGEVMAVKHRDLDVYGVQFHPESVLTPDGKKILKNFLTITKKRRSE